MPVCFPFKTREVILKGGGLPGTIFFLNIYLNINMILIQAFERGALQAPIIVVPEIL